MLLSNDNGLMSLWKGYNFCLLQAIWLVKKGHNPYLSSFSIHDTSLACDPLFGFFRSLTPQQEQVRNVILIRIRINRHILLSCWLNLNLCIFTYMDHSLYVCKILCFHRISWKMSSLYQPHNIVAFLSCLKWNYFLLKSHLKKSSLNFNLVKTFYMITNIMGNKKYFRFISRYSVYIGLLNILQLTLVISNSMGPWKKFESTVVRLKRSYENTRSVVCLMMKGRQLKLNFEDLKPAMSRFLERF
jgi:hypothetical protein